MLKLEIAPETLTCHVSSSASCVWSVGNTDACGSGLLLPGLSLGPLNAVRNIGFGGKRF